jgi:hypothetical protein
MIGHTTSSAASLRLSSYVEKVAGLTDVGSAAPPRRGCDLRIDAACLHLAEVHSMPLHRIVEMVARAIARRARNGTRSSGRGGARGIHQGPMENARERP